MVAFSIEYFPSKIWEFELDFQKQTKLKITFPGL